MQDGFFTKKEIESISRPDGKTYSCASCGLYKDCQHPRMQPYGNFKKKIMNIGEAPGEIEDQKGLPWQGKTGKLLQHVYKKLGVDLFEDCININAVHCRPMDKDGHNRTPENYEVDCCRKTTIKAIEQYKPDVIILLGNVAIYSLIGHRWKNDLGGVTKWRGFHIPDQDFNTWICPTFHPSFIDRADNNDVVDVIWENDLRGAFNHLNIPFLKYKEPEIKIIKDLNILNSITNSTIAIDYETTGLKPHAQGHRIVSCAIADSPDHVYVFMMPEKRGDRRPLTNLLANPYIPKRAHNMKFEEAWSVVRLMQPVIGWEWDSMVMAHILDNRPGINSLKFQTYINLGIVDYASEVAPFLKAKDDKNANSINKILDFIAKPGGAEKLMTYNAYDAINEYRLSNIQKTLVEDTALPF
jgi:DNA polymerase